MSDGRQRQRHGVAKNLAEGIGGLLVGAAAVLLLRQFLGGRQVASAAPVQPSAPVPPGAPAPGAERDVAGPPKARPRRATAKHAQESTP